MPRLSRPRCFLTRLWAFLNYRTTVRLTWLELLTASLVGLLVVWTGLNDWAGLAFAGPVAIYLVLLGFYREVHIPVGWVRGVYQRLFKPLTVPAKTNEKLAPTNAKRIYGSGLIVAAGVVTALLWHFDLRVALLFALLALVVVVLFWIVDARETLGGTLQLQTVAGRIPVQRILEDGQVVNRDGTCAKLALITLGRTGFQPALKAVDVAETLTKFLAYLAQHEEGGQPIKLFWLTDYHLGQLDPDEAARVPPEYVQELRTLAKPPLAFWERGTR